MSRIILITGATGLIGNHLIKGLTNREDETIIVTRNRISAGKKFPALKKIVEWNDLLSLSDEKIDAVINLAGMNLDEKRWSVKVKKELYDSRIKSTHRIVELVSLMSNKPGVLINSSGVDFYGDTGDRDVFEDSPPGNSFISKLVVDWEKEALEAEKFGIRVVLMRTGFVIAPYSKAFKKMILPFKFFAGGFAGSGKQYMSWIHIEDLVRAYIFAIENRQVRGAVNASSPNPVTMRMFAKHIGKAMHRPSFFPAPEFLLKILFGEIAHVLTSGRKALPKKLMDAGFKFNFETVADAIRNVLR
jgi:uncharacterized protein (TIGR01777 family)